MKPVPLPGDFLKGCEVLLASPRPSVHDSLSGILDRCQCCLYRLATCEKALAFLCERPVSVVICDTDLPDGTWKDLLNRISQLACAPNLIVASRLADERLWAEVLNLGGYDLVFTPFDPAETIRTVENAFADWNLRRSDRSRKATTAQSSSGPAGVSVAGAA